MKITRKHIIVPLALILASTLLAGLSPAFAQSGRGVRAEYSYRLGFFLPTSGDAYGGWMDGKKTSLSDDNVSIRNTLAQSLRWDNGFALGLSGGLIFTYVDGDGLFMQYVVPVMATATYEIPVPTNWPLIPYAGAGIGAYFGYADVDAESRSGYRDWDDTSLSRGLHLLVGAKFFPESYMPLYAEILYENFDLAYELPYDGYGRGEISRRGGGFTINFGIRM